MMAQHTQASSAFGRLIKRLLVDYGMTQRSAAAMMEKEQPNYAISAPTISNAVNSATVPDHSTIWALALLFYNDWDRVWTAAGLEPPPRPARPAGAAPRPERGPVHPDPDVALLGTIYHQAASGTLSIEQIEKLTKHLRAVYQVEGWPLPEELREQPDDSGHEEERDTVS